jgi:hypothetical protein
MGRRKAKNDTYEMDGVSDKSLNKRAQIRIKRHTLMGAVGTSFKKVKHKLAVAGTKKGKGKVAAGEALPSTTGGKGNPLKAIHAGKHGAHGGQDRYGMKEHGDKHGGGRDKAGHAKHAHTGHGHLHGKIGTHSAAESVAIHKQTPKEDARGRHHQTNKSTALGDEDGHHSHKAATKLQVRYNNRRILMYVWACALMYTH